MPPNCPYSRMKNKEVKEGYVGSSVKRLTLSWFWLRLWSCNL